MNVCLDSPFFCHGAANLWAHSWAPQPMNSSDGWVGGTKSLMTRRRRIVRYLAKDSWGPKISSSKTVQCSRPCDALTNLSLAEQSHSAKPRASGLWLPVRHSQWPLSGSSGRDKGSSESGSSCESELIETSGNSWGKSMAGRWKHSPHLSRNHISISSQMADRKLSSVQQQTEWHPAGAKRYCVILVC